ncbi:MAG: GTPase Era, partial [Saprospiraceae bacterium]|nr:GTPase Era [Saprospiraceae bacterium]
MFKSGFVNIVGRPNVGKSTLVNTLIGENVSITTFKPQTTRHRILGIINEENYQIVISDTPGYVHDPSYRMHEKMNSFVMTSFEDADIMILVTDRDDQYDKEHRLIQKLNSLSCPVFLAINKVDLIDDETLLFLITKWKDLLSFKECIPISALKGMNTDKLLTLVKENLPEGPVYFPEDQLSDRTERFFVSEIIREQIFLQYREEIPYSCDVSVESFKDEETIVRIEAYI